MKRRLFTKNLAALLVIPFVAKADEYAPVGASELQKQKEVVYSEEIDPKKQFLGNNIMLLQIKNKYIKILLFEISLEMNRNMDEVRMLNNDIAWVESVSVNLESQVRIIGEIVEGSMPTPCFDRVKFTVFFSEDHYLEGNGLIMEMSIGGGIIDFCIDIDNNIMGNYEGNMLNTRGYKR